VPPFRGRCLIWEDGFAGRIRNIEAVSSLAAQDRPGAHQWLVWQGPGADKAEALQSAEKADPRVDLEWMRIRHERDIIKGGLPCRFPVGRLNLRFVPLTWMRQPFS
jgi:hypothetical protein